MGERVYIYIYNFYPISIFQGERGLYGLELKQQWLLKNF